MTTPSPAIPVEARPPLPAVVWWIAFAAVALRIALFFRLELYADEAYYWTWSLHPAFGYFDHPPMVAWLAGAASWVLPGELGVRSLFLVCGGLTVVLTALTARELTPHPQAPVFGALLSGAAPLLILTGALALPDAPLELFYTLAIWAVVRAGGRRWLLAGVACGLAVLSKYAAGIFAPAMLAATLIDPEIRQDLRTWRPWAGGLLAALVFLPCVLWNAQHDFASYRFQAHNAFHGTGPDRTVTEFVGTVIGGAGVTTVPLAIAFLLRGKSPAGRRLALLIAFPLLTLLRAALHGRVEANWPAFTYPAICAAAAAELASWRPRFARPLTGATIALGVVAMGWYGVEVRAPHFLKPWSPPIERLHGWKEIIPEVLAASHGATFIYASNYQYAGELAYYGGVRRLGFTFDRRSQFDLWGEKPAPGEHAVVVSADPLNEEVRRLLDVDPAQEATKVTSHFAGAEIRHLFVTPTRSMTRPNAGL